MARIKVSKEVEEGKVFAFLGVFLTVIGFIIVLLAKRKNRYAMYYAKQGLVLFIAYLVVWVVSLFLRFVPLVGNALSWLLQAGLMVLWIVGWVYALSGEEKDIPLLGRFGERFNV